MEKVHLICNAHLDPVWLWEWEEGAAEALSTFRVAADLCEEYDGFVFNHNEAILYKWIEQYDQKLFARIQRLVAADKWHIMGGWYLQPDCNMPSGESIVRQIQYGRRYFREKFGKVPSTAVNFDSFGHSRGLVQILKKAGYDSYVICRPGCAKKKVKGSDFIWEGYDGSEIAVHVSDENYNSVSGKAAEELSDWLEKHKSETTGLFLWGVGDHGGGPSREDFKNITELSRNRKDIKFLHSVPEDYFMSIKGNKSMERVGYTLGPEMTGCYTSQIRVKQEHRKLENQLYLCEKMMSNASAQGLTAYPQREFDMALTALLASEFHDALPGSAIKPVEEATLQQLHFGLKLIAELRAKAFFALSSGQKKVVEGETPILVYNPHPYKLDMIIECELVLPKQNWNGDFMEPQVYSGSNKIACQTEQELSNFRLDWRKRVVFHTELHPCSMNRFDCGFRRLERKPPVAVKPQNGVIRFENGEIVIGINCATGLIDRYQVKGVDYLREGAFRPVVMKDTYNSWDAGFSRFSDIEGAFSLMSPEEGSEFSGLPGSSLPSVRVAEDGEVRMVVEALFRYNNSFIRQLYKLPKRGTEVEVETWAYWLEKDKMLKLTVPASFTKANYYGQAIWGSEQLRDDGTEAVSQKWNAIVSKVDNKAVTLINNGTYGSNFHNGELRATLLRSAAYSASDFEGRRAMSPDCFTPRMDQGERIYRFWLNAGDARERMKRIDREAQVHNEEPCALSFCPSGEGNLPVSLVVLNNDSIVLLALKKAELSGNYIIRLQNPEPEMRTSEIRIPVSGISLKLNFRSFEVKTLELDLKRKEISETELLR